MHRCCLRGVVETLALCGIEEGLVEGDFSARARPSSPISAGADFSKAADLSLCRIQGASTCCKLKLRGVCPFMAPI